MADDYPRQYAASLAGGDHEAFWRQIAADPTDNLPPLVYADFLDDRGHGELAKIIRRSIQEGHGPTYRPNATKPEEAGTYQNLHGRLQPYIAERPEPWNWGGGEKHGEVSLWGRSNLGPDYGIDLEVLTPFGLVERTTRAGNTFTSRGPLHGPHDKALVRMTVRAGRTPLGLASKHRSFEAPMTVPELHALADSLHPFDSDSESTAARLKHYVSNPNRFRQTRA